MQHRMRIPNLLYTVLIPQSLVFIDQTNVPNHIISTHAVSLSLPYHPSIPYPLAPVRFISEDAGEMSAELGVLLGSQLALLKGFS